MKKKRILSMMILVCLCLALLAACSAKEENVVSRTVVDMSGKHVEIPNKVDKYCILYSSAVSMCGMLDEDLSHLCICPTLYADWTYELFPNLKEHVITVDKRSVTAEQIAHEGAQVVFWSTSSDELIESLESLGIACVNVRVKDADQLLQAMNIIAQTFGTDYAKNQLEKYEETFTNYRQYAEEHRALIPESEKKSVLVLNGVDDPTGFGANSIEAYWAELVGLDYILPSDDGADKVTLTMEQIYEYDPDIIVFEGFLNEEEIDNNYPEWNTFIAAENHMVTAAPSALDTWAKAGAEMPLQYIWALSAFYPDYAGDINMMEQTIKFYKDFYQYDMSEEHATEMLAGHRIIFGEEVSAAFR